jgi:undecaprenyl-diphosphatase
MVVLNSCKCLENLIKRTIRRVVKRQPPCHMLEGIQILKVYSPGLFSFPSTHSVLSSALESFLSLLYRKIQLFPTCILFCAFMISYSRPYFGIHYPSDVFFCSIIGRLIGIMTFFLFHIWIKFFYLYSMKRVSKHSHEFKITISTIYSIR